MLDVNSYLQTPSLTERLNRSLLGYTAQPAPQMASRSLLLCGARRYTGEHWGHFLNSVLNLAASKLSDKLLTPEEQEYVGNNHALPAHETKLPDFLGFGE